MFEDKAGINRLLLVLNRLSEGGVLSYGGGFVSWCNQLEARGDV